MSTTHRGIVPGQGALHALSTASGNLMSVSSSVLEHFLPGFTTIQGFFSQWLNVDITKFVTMFFLLGAFGSTIRRFSTSFYVWLTRFLTASVSIPACDRLNREVLLWMSQNVVTQRGTRVLAAQSSRTLGNDLAFMPPPPMPGGLPRHAGQVARRKLREKLKAAPIEYYPSFGSTWFFFKGRLFLFRRSGNKYDSQNTDDFWSAPDGSEPLVIICVGRSPEPLKEFLQACRDNATTKTESFTSIHLCQDGFRASWDTSLLRPVRPLETVDLDEILKKDIVDDIEAYLAPSTRRFYARRGIPYRRGYLFHGEPGTGKTSFCLALAGHFNLELYCLNLTNLADASCLLRLFAALPNECIVVIEDVDSAGIQRDAADEDWAPRKKARQGPALERGAVTLSGLLNALDGLASQEGRVLIMTSNTPDALDKALIRPGRVDKQVHFGLLNERIAESIFLRMFTLDDSEEGSGGEDDIPESANKLIKELSCKGISLDALRSFAVQFARRIPPNTLSPAEVQGYLLRHRESPAAAVEHVEAWIQELREQKERREKARQKARARAKERAERQEARRKARAKARQEARKDSTRSSSQTSSDISGTSSETYEDSETESEYSTSESSVEDVLTSLPILPSSMDLLPPMPPPPPPPPPPSKSKGRKRVKVKHIQVKRSKNE